MPPRSRVLAAALLMTLAAGAVIVLPLRAAGASPSPTPVPTPQSTTLPVIHQSPQSTPRPAVQPRPTPSPSASSSAFTGARGAVLVAGCDWAPTVPDCADLNVYGNGTGLANMDCSGPDGCTYGPDFQCTELVQRYAAHAWNTPALWDGYGGDNGAAYQLWDAGAALPQPLQRFDNGGAVAPSVGDIIVFGTSADDSTGHVAVVSAVTDANVTIVEQNGNPSGREQIARSGTSLWWRLPVIGWMHMAPPPAPPVVPHPWPPHHR